ncbi:PilX N-terminal domain-containing pilus assembly protein [Colwellia ponticola]|uniref:Type II secretory pathway component n=1 Tax=Colwellia ponticola TaxID=2304625 RepID=A0A8H2JSQ9_9GAMM|nr:PilX N-terminal domain-containing pilus assembly protein [Colwellia ponticola]TMM47828.1 type II secretory pathway component [Colwellia ponticola]
MFRKSSLNVNRLTQQKGSALVLAIFIIVVMTLLGTALVRMISTNAETIVYEVIGTRAYQAAQAGAQRKLREIFPLSSASSTCPVAPSTYSFVNTEGLKGCEATVIVDCKLYQTVNNITYYTVISTGKCSVGEVLTSRTIEIDARSL